MQLLLAVDLEGVTGALFLKIRSSSQSRDAIAWDREDGQRLWELSERLAENAPAAQGMPAPRPRTNPRLNGEADLAIF